MTTPLQCTRPPSPGRLQRQSHLRPLGERCRATELDAVLVNDNRIRGEGQPGLPRFDSHLMERTTGFNFSRAHTAPSKYHTRRFRQVKRNDLSATGCISTPPPIPPPHPDPLPLGGGEGEAHVLPTILPRPRRGGEGWGEGAGGGTDRMRPSATTQSPPPPRSSRPRTPPSESSRLAAPGPKRRLHPAQWPLRPPTCCHICEG